MKNRRKLRPQATPPRRPFRPNLDLLEDRIPPGDAALSVFAGLSALGSAPTPPAPEARPAEVAARPQEIGRAHV